MVRVLFRTRTAKLLFKERRESRDPQRRCSKPRGRLPAQCPRHALSRELLTAAADLPQLTLLCSVLAAVLSACIASKSLKRRRCCYSSRLCRAAEPASPVNAQVSLAVVEASIVETRIYSHHTPAHRVLWFVLQFPCTRQRK
jgi:hypothetical protein